MGTGFFVVVGVYVCHVCHCSVCARAARAVPCVRAAWRACGARQCVGVSVCVWGRGGGGQ